jgi:hypothetical protein
MLTTATRSQLLLASLILGDLHVYTEISRVLATRGLTVQLVVQRNAVSEKAIVEI